MTKQRKIEILEQAISLISNVNVDGICKAFVLLKKEDIIDYEELGVIEYWFNSQIVPIKLRGDHYIGGRSVYLWYPYKTEPRIKFLQYLINKLENEEII